MAKGRGNAVSAAALLLCLVLVHQTEVAQAANYTIKWNLQVASWLKKKIYNVNDVLVFKYDATQHNVLVVDKRNYGSCTVPKGAKPNNTGSDGFKLNKGSTYFICTKTGHCAGGMKLDITAV